MIGGLMKTASRFVIAASMLGAGAMLMPANAADLGGDCCADLEERVAELEATAVKHGNRKVSLTIAGGITEGIIFWDDSFARDKNIIVPDAYGAGLSISGEGSIRPDLKVGYVIALDIRHGDPGDSDGKNNAVGGQQLGSLQDYNRADKIAIDKQFVYIDSAHVGRLSIGKRNDVYSSERFFDGSIIDMAAGIRPRDEVTGDVLRTGSATGKGAGWGQLLGGIGDVSGMMVRYDTPSLAGFTMGVSWGNDDTATFGVGYKGDLQGNVIEATYGYTADTTDLLNEDVIRQTVNGRYTNTPSGIFIQGSYEWLQNDSLASDRTAWQIKGGWSKDVTGMGATNLFAIYQKADGFAQFADNVWFNGARVWDSEATGWGLGVEQDIDATGSKLILRYDLRSVDSLAANAAGAPLLDTPGDTSTLFFGMKQTF
jgi:hypothetical protein